MTDEAEDREDGPAPAPPAKSEPEIARSLRLRQPPPPVTRLSRRVLIGAAAVFCLTVGGATWWALENKPSATKPAPELYSGASKPNLPDKLSAAPHDYGQPGAVPKLGPPLPGDLGRPILAAQNGTVDALTGATATAPGMAGSTSNAPQPPPDPVRLQAEQTRQAARTSRLFASMAEAPSAAAATGTGSEAAGSLPLPAGFPLAPTPAANPAEPAAAPPSYHKLAFLAAGPSGPAVNPARLAAPASPYLVQAGTLIEAALITGVRSDIPGQVTAQVTQDVYDTVTGRIRLIPQGARLVGTYDSQVGFGQSRVLLVWTRLILPNGKSLDLGRAPAADRAGYAGLQDGVDRHWRALFGAAALSTVLSIGSDVGSSNADSDLVQALRRGTSDTLNRAGEEAVRRQLDVQPTLTIRPGHAVRVVVEHDLVLEPYVEGSAS